jgi:hypothetical protein
MNLPTTIKQLNEFAIQLNAKKYEHVPPHAVPRPKVLSDKDANSLTASVLFDFIHIRGGYAFRVNNMGVYDAKRGVYRKGGTVKGIPDIIGLIDGRFIGIEIKFGSDRMSADQMEMKREIESNGGIYIVAKRYEQYVFDLANAVGVGVLEL